ncbi:YraN family protein [Thermogutta sp.]|uniref:YraN family protein n=1 Tax=Thermogutta sp. TaxID=1962930 RepID=UPI00321FA30C
MVVAILRIFFREESLFRSRRESRERPEPTRQESLFRNPRRILGEASEAAACRFLVQRGYQIVARNVQFRSGELDIVATDGKSWIFVEVRSRRSESDPDIAATVTPAKQHRVIRAALEYLRSSGGPRKPLRFDVITVLWPKDNPGNPEITHWESAFGCD